MQYHRKTHSPIESQATMKSDWMFSIKDYSFSFFFRKTVKNNYILNAKDINIVWLKRDLRLQDHEPLYKAEQSGTAYIIIYLFEPNIIEYRDTSPRHLQFIYHSIKSLNKSLKNYNRNVDVLYGEAIDIFNFLNKHYNIQQLFSYQESGIKKTWNVINKSKNFVLIIILLGQKANVMEL